jgi:tRNA (mo5U34)-methyltransferase
MGFHNWVQSEVEAEPYWFHRIELAPGLVTPGWNDPIETKVPYFRLPDDMTGMRVLDVGCSEGFFSFEAERRGASEVVAIDSAPDSIRRFNICRAALGSSVQGYLTNVYDLSPRTFGTFDLVMFYGVLYHLRHPLLALEKVFEVCSGELRMQTYSFEDSERVESAAQFHPFGIKSGPPENPIHDPTVLWVPNAACARDMLLHVGFTDVQGGPTPAAAVFSATAPVRSPGVGPDWSKAPFS